MSGLIIWQHCLHSPPGHEPRFAADVPRVHVCGAAARDAAALGRSRSRSRRRRRRRLGQVVPGGRPWVVDVVGPHPHPPPPPQLGGEVGEEGRGGDAGRDQLGTVAHRSLGKEGGGGGGGEEEEEKKSVK